MQDKHTVSPAFRHHQAWLYDAREIDSVLTCDRVALASEISRLWM